MHAEEPLTMRIVSPNDLDVWTAFHRRHASKFVKERDPEQLKRAARGRKLFMFFNEHADPKGSCGLFEYGDGTYREAGAVMVLVPGYGLQVTLMSAAVYSEWVYDPAPAACLAITAVNNTPSRKNIVRTGFIQVDQIEHDRLDVMGLYQLDSEKCYYLFPDTSMQCAQEHLAEARRLGGVHRPESFQPLRLDIPLAWDGFI